MPVSLPRSGVVEIELLRRYGTVPVGTRAAGTFTLGDSASPGWRALRVDVPVEGHPQGVRGEIHFQWRGEDDERPYTYGRSYRGGSETYTVDGLLGYATLNVRLMVEEMDTSAKHQRFRVVRVAWDAD